MLQLPHLVIAVVCAAGCAAAIGLRRRMAAGPESFWFTLEAGKFKALAPWFKNVTFDEVLDLDDDVFDQACPQHLRAFLCLFRRKYVEPYRAMKRPPRPSVRRYDTELTMDKIMPIFRAGVLDLSCAIAPGCSNLGPPPSGLTLPNLHKLVETADPAIRESVRIVNASYNTLHAEDFAAMETLADLFPRLELIDLSGCRLAVQNGPFDHLKKLLECKSSPVVNITATAAAGSDCGRFVVGLSHTEAARLIWLPKDWLESDAWSNMLKRLDAANGAARAQLVHQVHDAFYRQVRSA